MSSSGTQERKCIKDLHPHRFFQSRALISPPEQAQNVLSKGISNGCPQSTFWLSISLYICLSLSLSLSVSISLSLSSLSLSLSLLSHSYKSSWARIRTPPFEWSEGAHLQTRNWFAEFGTDFPQSCFQTFSVHSSGGCRRYNSRMDVGNAVQLVTSADRAREPCFFNKGDLWTPFFQQWKCKFERQEKVCVLATGREV